MQDGRRPS
jgi:hypothetical protein